MQTLLDDVLGAGVVAVGAVSLAATAVGGFHALYRGLRPEHWAAAPGSGVQVRLLREVGASSWQEVLGRRLGERAVDGLGVLGLVELTDGAGEVAETVATPGWPQDGRTRLPTGETVDPTAPDAVTAVLAGAPNAGLDDISVWALARLQDRLFWAAATAAADVRCAELARQATELPPRHVLGALREAAASASAPHATGVLPLTAVFGDIDLDPAVDGEAAAAAALDRLRQRVRIMLRPDASQDTVSRAGAALNSARVGSGTALSSWLQEDAAAPGPGEEIVHDLRQAALWPDDDAVCAAWITRHRAALRLLQVQSLLDRLVAARGTETGPGEGGRP